MFFNQVTLVGTIATDLRHRKSTARRDQEPMSVVDFKLVTERQQGKHERMSIRVVAFGGAAETFRRYKKKGDYILISGRLCQTTFEGKEGGTVEHHYVVAERFQFLWGPPGKFIKNHVLVPRDEYARFKALEEEAGGPFHVPDQIVKDLGLDQPLDFRELQALDPEDAERVTERILQERSRETLNIPGHISGSRSDREPGNRSRGARK